MIEVEPFNLENLKKYQAFYCLKTISDVDSLRIVHNTPSGFFDIEKVSAFLMPNGNVIIAWANALNMSIYYNLIAISDNKKEIITINSIDRIIDIYDKEVNSPIGVFSFANSDVVIEPNKDWRCDQGKYGPRAFPPNPAIAQNPANILIFEPVLSVTGSGHLVYLEYKNSGEDTLEHLNNAPQQTIGRTIWESLKIIREWAITNEEPFNNQDLISKKAAEFIREMNFSDEEFQHIDNQVPMQIARYLMGNENARQRPEEILEIDEGLKNIVFKRLSSGTMSAIEKLNPGMWNLQELIEVEKNNLIEHRDNFSKRASEIPEMRQDYINLQERVFNNRESILNKIENGEF
jgi:hypothetical protein